MHLPPPRATFKYPRSSASSQFASAFIQPATDTHQSAWFKRHHLVLRRNSSEEEDATDDAGWVYECRGSLVLMTRWNCRAVTVELWRRVFTGSSEGSVTMKICGLLKLWLDGKYHVWFDWHHMQNTGKNNNLLNRFTSSLFSLAATVPFHTSAYSL